MRHHGFGGSVIGDGPAIVDLPTPPLADETATTFWTFGIRRLVGRPRLGI